ncbi:MAG: XRE family transcriptional regulator [Ruminococcaceae bacterium]|nr:XRE family transcriptional regulator [Oscillospiraceae bacterium]
MLAAIGLSINRPMAVIDISKGLSLNDCYWVVKEEFDGKFSDYNLYDHAFEKTLSLIAYVGYGSVKTKGFTSSPEFTTNGMLRKGWRQIGGKTLLYKGGTEGASNAGNEPYSEFYAAQIAAAMGLNHIDYTLASWKKSVCSVCELFTSKKLAFVPIWRFGEFNNVVDVAEYLKALGDKYYNDFVDMMIFDALIYNTDRHQGNFGLLVDTKTNKPVAFAPIFDNGLGLFPYAVKNDLENIAAYAKTRDAAFGVPFDEIAKAYISDRQRKQLRKVLTFSFTKDKNYNLPAYRLKAIEKFIQARAGELIEM